MTEQSIDRVAIDSNNQASTTTPDVSQQETPISAQKTEKTFTESRVNELIHQRTKEAVQRATDRVRSEYETQAQASQQVGLGGIQQKMPNEQELRQMMQEEVKRHNALQHEEYTKMQAQKQVNDLANDYLGKLTAAKDKYPELEKRQDEIGDLGLLIPYINEFEDAAGLTDHLINNEHHVASLLVLANTSPTFLRRSIKKLEASIKTNEAAKNRVYPNEPFNPVTPSINTMDSGSGSDQTIESLKTQDYLRG